MIENETGLRVELFRSSGGVFEVAMDGELLYSKKKTGEFPEDEEVVAMIKARKT